MASRFSFSSGYGILAWKYGDSSEKAENLYQAFHVIFRAAISFLSFSMSLPCGSSSVS